ncbi:MAG: type II toxin-antitoxin system HicB family antitoxin [Candidatus Dormibacteraeota bacterium]|uniref:Type II toxin-antitoxin system HicB family antitoxin n=1 Tax=Candidatus Aeolococcus gillhamiae TaxID=3127015 RepID=A0A2W5Z6H7_9BACT|nr:type II toxin-antitoxin system HicB family antitoxin [Candidatus Dormibacteraeota bacterium]PZR79647.1 MAG: type II toxin-antitoxin system HicB family antitoxin [Candidatus Dormibacter sp. RRmetagenome_bin12]
MTHLNAVVWKEDDWYVARCVQVEVASQGHSVEEALANLTEALELYFEDAPAPARTDTHALLASLDVQLPIPA